jgi:hypothetical protein
MPITAYPKVTPTVPRGVPRSSNPHSFHDGQGSRRKHVIEILPSQLNEGFYVRIAPEMV